MADSLTWKYEQAEANEGYVDIPGVGTVQVVLRGTDLQVSVYPGRPVDAPTAMLTMPVRVILAHEENSNG